MMYEHREFGTALHTNPRRKTIKKGHPLEHSFSRSPHVQRLDELFECFLLNNEKEQVVPVSWECIRMTSVDDVKLSPQKDTIREKRRGDVPDRFKKRVQSLQSFQIDVVEVRCCNRSIWVPSTSGKKQRSQHLIHCCTEMETNTRKQHV